MGMMQLLPGVLISLIAIPMIMTGSFVLEELRICLLLCLIRILLKLGQNPHTGRI